MPDSITIQATPRRLLPADQCGAAGRSLQHSGNCSQRRTQHARSGDRYSQPAGAQPPAGGMDQGSSYQPGAMATPIGATGYNPVDNAYSTTAGSAMSSLPSRGNSEYRPGGTSNYVSPTGNAVQPASTDSHTPGVVSPAGFQSASTGNAQNHTGVTLASATAPVGSSSAVYGTYQGSASATTPTAGSSSNFNSSSEPAYGAPNPVAATPGCCPRNRPTKLPAATAHSLTQCDTAIRGGPPLVVV